MGAVPISSAAAFATGLKAAGRSVFVYVIFGTFIGYGALCHDLDFSLPWAVASTVLIWAGPAQGTKQPGPGPVLAISRKSNQPEPPSCCITCVGPCVDNEDVGSPQR